MLVVWSTLPRAAPEGRCAPKAFGGAQLRRRQSVSMLALSPGFNTIYTGTPSVCAIGPGGLNIGLRALKFEHKILDRIFKKMAPAIFLVRPSFRVISILETFTF